MMSIGDNPEAPQPREMIDLEVLYSIKTNFFRETYILLNWLLYILIFWTLFHSVKF